MKCLPYESRIEKDLDGFIWFNKDSLEQSFNDQASFVGLGMGYLVWKKDGISHREYGKPAFISYATKIQSWYIDGQFVRKERILDSEAIIVK